MSEAKIMLDWIPTTALREFIEHHWYYLPESIEKDPLSWMFTMQELLCELHSREMATKLIIYPNTSDYVDSGEPE